MSQNRLELTLPARTEALEVLSEHIATLLAPIEEISNRAQLIYYVQLAVQELCANIVQHAYKGAENGVIDITLTVDLEPTRLTVLIRDTGHSFDLASVPRPTFQEVQVHGYGLYLLRQLMDEVVYMPEVGNNRWHLLKYLQGVIL